MVTTQHCVVLLFFTVEVNVLQSTGLSNIQMNADFQLRSKRNSFLRESDWTQFNDSPLDATQKEKWAEYRQALRDLPSNSDPNLDEAGNLIGVIFPETPTFA